MVPFYLCQLKIRREKCSIFVDCSFINYHSFPVMHSHTLSYFEADACCCYIPTSLESQ